MAPGRIVLALSCMLASMLAASAARPENVRPVADHAGQSSPSASMASDVLRGDARLTDVCFVSPQSGWAVGDRGTIWHTANGGHRWQLQESGLSCRLESVFFLDERHGWAAGGWIHPYTHSSAGVVLATSDGGEHWSHNPRLFVPSLKKIRFFDGRRGWAIGSSSAMFPSGIFTTDNGGRSWTPISGEKWPGWTAGDFLDPSLGTVAGPRALASVHRAGLHPSQTIPFGLRSIARLQLVPPAYGMLIGQGALVCLTSDSGDLWREVPGQFPPGIAEQFDFRALAVRGEKCWIAGTPGTRVFFTPDAGHTWSAAATQQCLPLESMTFVDDQHGWAVGQLGTILASEDGGQTWHRQRAGGTRIALLTLMSQPEDVPFELLAKLSGDEGYLSGVQLVNRRDLDTPPREETDLSDRLRDAVVNVGGSEAAIQWRFPLRPPGLSLTDQQVLAGWDQANNGRGMQELEACLARQIRTWRPDVLVTDDVDSRNDRPGGHLVAQAVLRAVAQAAESTAFPEQIAHAGLEAWQVKRVYAALKPGIHGSAELAVLQLAPRLGRPLADVTAVPRGLLETQPRQLPESCGFHLVYDQHPRPSESNDFFRGIPLEPGSEARRALLAPAFDTMQLAQRTAQRQRNLRAVLERASDVEAAPALLAQAGRLIQDLDPDSGAQVLGRLAYRYYGSGQWPLAAEAFQTLLERFPDHPLARPAQIWLLHYYASSEAAWRVRAPHAWTGSNSAPIATRPTAQSSRAEQAVLIGQEIQRTRPELFAEPSIGFPLAAADRQRGAAEQAARFYTIQARISAESAWSRCARGELWLADPKGPSPKPTLTCTATSEKPHLDGRLDENLWKLAEPAELKSPRPEEDSPATVLLAHDDRFLYVGLRCRQAPGAIYQPSNGPRTHDANLADQDRIDILLDTDRDYVTYDRLTVDHRGWTGESCWGDATWNPKWFVAASTEDGFWMVEAAIPLDQLTAEFPRPDSVWAVGLQRTIPRVGFQAWNAPASIDVSPEGFGYLIFK